MIHIKHSHKGFTDISEERDAQWIRIIKIMIGQ